MPSPTAAPHVAAPRMTPGGRERADRKVRSREHGRATLEIMPTEPSTGAAKMIEPKDRYTAEVGEAQMTGVQALARLPLNVRRADRSRGLETAAFISGYEGSPLGGYDLELGRNQKVLDAWDVVFRPGVNEELAATAVQGTQVAAASGEARVDGVTGYWY